MSTWRKISGYKSTCWLLVAAIILITLLPAHYHLHHLTHSDSATHAHTTDLHLLMKAVDQSHHDENTQSFSAVPDGITKKTDSAFFPLIFIVICLALLLPLIFRINRLLDYSTIGLKKIHYHLSPPLRAPPLLLQHL
jgi:hypothetical protein